MRLIVGISGASGSILAVELLRALRLVPDCETHLVISNGGRRTLELETGMTAKDIASLASRWYGARDIAAPISSGSFATDGIVIIPCSMRTLAGVAHGYGDNLLTRAADVCLKEKRRVVLVPREMPLSRVHLDNMTKAAEYGCTILPPMLTFYNNPGEIQDMIDHVVGKILFSFGIEFDRFRPWRGVADSGASRLDSLSV